jgi:glycosyltransferase involved in cell wall biosynthesis
LRHAMAMKILYLTTEDSSFWSHRLTLARAARNEGAKVVIMTVAGEYRARLEKEGFQVIPWSISRRSLNPFRALYSFFQVLRVYRRERPDLVHHVALKPIVYGGVAARCCGAIPAVNTVTGLGPVFTNSSPLMLLLRRVLTSLLRWNFTAANCAVIAQNQDDYALLVKQGITMAEKTIVIPGFGVATGQFVPHPEPGGVPIVMLAARMLREKGIREFVAAAKELRNQGVPARMVLVGEPDPKNPGCIPEKQLRAWVAAGSVEWWGQQGNMPSIICQSHVVCLPSYREGLPKVLLEAAACGRAIVTTSAPGCSHVVRHGENGLLVPIQDSQALATAISSLLGNKELRNRMGEAGRARALGEFSDEQVARQTLEVYQKLLHGKWHSAG